MINSSFSKRFVLHPMLWCSTVIAHSLVGPDVRKTGSQFKRNFFVASVGDVRPRDLLLSGKLWWYWFSLTKKLDCAIDINLWEAIDTKPSTVESSVKLVARVNHNISSLEDLDPDEPNLRSVDKLPPVCHSWYPAKFSGVTPDHFGLTSQACWNKKGILHTKKLERRIEFTMMPQSIPQGWPRACGGLNQFDLNTWKTNIAKAILPALLPGYYVKILVILLRNVLIWDFSFNVT